MDHLSIEVLAVVVATELAVAHPVVDDAMRDAIAVRVESAMRRLARQERDACAALCLERQAMWEATEARRASADIGRQGPVANLEVRRRSTGMPLRAAFRRIDTTRSPAQRTRMRGSTSPRWRLQSAAID